MAVSNAALKRGKNSIFVMWLMWLRIRFSTWCLYAFFSDEKQPTSGGCSRYDECEGIQRVMVAFCSHSCWK